MHTKSITDLGHFVFRHVYFYTTDNLITITVCLAAHACNADLVDEAPSGQLPKYTLSFASNTIQQPWKEHFSVRNIG